MKCLIYQVAVGAQKELYERCMASVAAYCKRYGYDHRIQREPILKIVPQESKRSSSAMKLGYLPIYEKENAFWLLGEYDQVLVLDADVYIRPNTLPIFGLMILPPSNAFAAVAERDMPVTAAYATKLYVYERNQYGPLLGQGLPFLQMGVMAMDKSLRKYLPATPQEFFALPQLQRFINGEGAWRWSTDQTMLNWWLRDRQVPVVRADWRWNYLYGMMAVPPDQAFFIHFLLSDHLASQDPQELLRRNYRLRI